MTAVLDPTPPTGPPSPVPSSTDPRTATLGRGRPELHLVVRSVVLVVAVVGAYRYSLATLLRSLGVDSPLAYLGLIPFLAAGVGWYSARPGGGEPDVHDRALDRILGVPLVVVPVAALLVLPAQLSSYFWVWRIDLLTFPLFVAGCVAILFGSRTLIRCRQAVLWLFAAWPVPYVVGLQRGLGPFTDLTVRALGVAVRHTGVARVERGSEGAFSVAGPDERFTLVVASACSGANSVVGFLLVGGAIALVSRGTRRAKAVWMATGLAAVWALNVARILVIFVVGAWWGERTAVEVFHPYIGLVFFSITVTSMMLLAPRFGVQLGAGPGPRRSLSRSVRAGAPAWRSASLVLLAVAALAGALNAQLRVVDPVAGALGAPRLAAFDRTATRMTGFTGEVIDHFDWTERFFGEDSDWTRYEFDGPGTAQLAATIPVIADVVTTSDLQTFNDFGVEACYRFHGYDVKDPVRVDLGSGVTGNLLTWKDPASPITWTTVYWHWPVRTEAGPRYQRIVLMFNSSTGARVAAPRPTRRLASDLGISIDAALNDMAGGASATADPIRLFLVAFAGQMVRDSAARSAELGEGGI